MIAKHVYMLVLAGALAAGAPQQVAAAANDAHAACTIVVQLKESVLDTSFQVEFTALTKKLQE